MKKISIVAVGFVTVGVLRLGDIAYAEETTASVKVNSGGIKISEIKNITFNDVTVRKGGLIATEKDRSSVSVEDLRGQNSKGWTLTAKLKDENFKGMELNVAPKVESNTNAAKAGAAANLNSQSQKIASIADMDIKTTEFDTNVSLNVKLNIPEKQLANTYTTTIVWDLVEGP